MMAQPHCTSRQNMGPGHEDIVKVLFLRGVNGNTKNKQGIAAAELALENGFEKVARILTKGGIGIDEYSEV